MSGNPADTGRDIIRTIILAVPKVVDAIIIFIIGYVIAMILKTVIAGILKKTGLNHKVAKAPQGSAIRKITQDPAKLIGSLVYWLIMIYVVTLAILALRVPVLDQIIYDIYHYTPNIIAAILILVAAIVLAAGTASISLKLVGDTPTGRIMAAVVPPFVLAIAVFMILVQLKITPSIVIITYTAIVGALALGFALAFGLGGRDIAGRLLEGAYNRGREHLDQAKRDMQKVKERGKEKAEQ